MTLFSIFKAGLTTLFLLLPGSVFSIAFFRARLSNLTHLTVGLALGLVALVHINVIASVLGGISRNSVLLGTLILYLVSFSLALVRKPTVRLSDISFPKRSESLLIAGVVCWAVVVRLIPLFFSRYPSGWDSSFHVIIAKIVAVTGRVPTTWQPFEKIPLNYPWGSHLLVNNVSMFSGAKIHESFAFLNSLFFGFLSVLAIYILARLFYGERLPAIMAAAAYGLLANWGSLNYGAWGGLPNQIGMFLFICVSYILLEDRLRFGEKAVFAGFLLSGIILVHNHAMMVSIYVLASYLLIVVLAKRKLDTEARTVLTLLALALVFSLYYAWGFFVHALGAQNTAILRFRESLDIFELPLYLGVFLVIFYVVGVMFYQRKNSRNFVYLLSWKVSLFLAFAGFYYFWKFYTKASWGESFVAFTPSRFVTDLVYPVSIIAGGGIAVVARQLAKYRLLPILFLSFIVGVVPLSYTAGLWRQALAADAISALEFIRTHTPDNSLVVNNTPEQIFNAKPEHTWAPYISERESTVTPLPVTELTGMRISEVKLPLVKFLLKDGRLPDYPKGRYIKEFGGRPVYFYGDLKVAANGFSEVYANNTMHVYKVDIERLLK